MAGSEGLVYYGETFSAPCSNDFWNEEMHGYDDCGGTVTFGPTDRQAACSTCGARCGRLVAFGLPSGDPYRAPACESLRTNDEGPPCLRGGGPSSVPSQQHP